MIKYYRTYQNGGQSTHLEGICDSYTLCGVDTAGDDSTHEHPPEELPPGKHRATCPQCQQVIALVLAHLGRLNTKVTGAARPVE